MALCVVGGWAVLRDRSSTPTLEELQDLGWSACFVLNLNENETDQNRVDDIWEMNNNGEISNGQALSLACSVDIREREDVWTITYQPDYNYSDGGFRAVKRIGNMAGCLTDSDSERLLRTRAIDGLVEGERRGTSWTYSPSNGLAVICKK